MEAGLFAFGLTVIAVGYRVVFLACAIRHTNTLQKIPHI